VIFTGARRSLGLARRALEEGRLDDAAGSLRAYFALRYRRGRQELVKIDVTVVELAGLVAMLRGDAAELGGAAELLAHGERSDTLAARHRVGLMQAALAGDLAKIDAELKDDAPFAAEILLVACERAGAATRPAHADRLARIGGQLDVGGQGRAAVAGAIAYARARDRQGAAGALARVGSESAPLVKLAAALVRFDGDRARKAFGDLAPADRPGAAALAARVLAGAPSEAIRAARGFLDEAATPETKEALSGALACALAREGDELGARAAAGDRGLVAAWVALARGDAHAAEKLAEGDDPAAQQIRRAAKAQLGELEGATPEVAPILLAALARRREPPPALPPVLAARPADPRALHAWACVRLAQGAYAEALSGFEEAIAARPELKVLGDHPDAARLGAADAGLAAGRAESSARLASGVTSERLKPAAARLRALALVAAAPGETFAARLAAAGDAAAPIAAETRVLRARELLEAGDATGARAVLGDALATPEEKFLDAAARALLGEPIDRPHGYAAGYALLAEGSGLPALEGAPRGEPLVEEARCAAYLRAGRSVDARRVALAELKRRGAEIPTGILADAFRAALAWELPSPDVNREAVAPESSDPFPIAELPDRLAALRARAPASVMALVDEVEAAVAAGELAVAAARERQVIDAIRKAGRS
jgi:hypothetical protein